MSANAHCLKTGVMESGYAKRESITLVSDPGNINLHPVAFYPLDVDRDASGHAPWHEFHGVA
jgi:hypothetical protein